MELPYARQQQGDDSGGLHTECLYSGDFFVPMMPGMSDFFVFFNNRSD
jgi:hypothetical protein